MGKIKSIDTKRHAKPNKEGMSSNSYNGQVMNDTMYYYAYDHCGLFSPRL